MVDDGSDARHYRDLTTFNQDEDAECESLGKIEKFSLSANRKLMAIYSNSDQGTLIVLKSDLTQELNRLTTGMIGAENLIWCGNDVTITEYVDKVIMVGPAGECLTLDLGNPKTKGLKCYCEIDGLRIVNSTGTFFLERVQDMVIETFKIAAITPAAKLLNAIKSEDLKIPRANEILNELSKEQLVEGMETLLELA